MGFVSIASHHAMGNVKEILHRPAPPILYHYTTQQGLLGIITSKELWASHTQYLNDVREFRHALDIVRDELSAVANEAGRDRHTRKCLAEMQDALIPGMEDINVCVCSFSERGDDLSQWRAYGGKTSGLAVGFSGELLREACNECGWLAPVLYDEEEQRGLVRRLLEDVLEENLDPKKSAESKVLGGNLGAYLYRYAPILKNKSFAEEREWRIITRPRMCTGDRFGYRIGPSTLIPYFRVALDKQKFLGIREIHVGPTPRPEQSRSAITGLLTKFGVTVFDPPSHWDEHSRRIYGESFKDVFGVTPDDAVKVRCSSVPYRNW